MSPKGFVRHRLPALCSPKRDSPTVNDAFRFPIVYLGLWSKFRFLWTVAAAPPGFGARRLWLAVTALSAFSLTRTLWSFLRRKVKESEGAPSSADFGSAGADHDSLDNRRRWFRWPTVRSP